MEQPWNNKISNSAQIGGIEMLVMENGGGRGTRVAWINTGTGLRYKVVVDRGLDIADAFYNEHSLTWISSSGITPPQPLSNFGTEWLRTFGGGLLTTCGLSHIGGPEKDEFGERGLHDQISNLPAEIISVVQPDPLSGRLEMSIIGIVRQTRLFGPSFQLRRTISGRLGHMSINIHDEVINCGNIPAPHMILYHCNFGWPLIDEGIDLIWKGKLRSQKIGQDNLNLTAERNFKKCPAPMERHSGSGEDVVVIDIAQDESGKCVCGIYNKAIGLALILKFRKIQLPWLTNWQHWGKGEYVTGLEPGTHPPIGQAQARSNNELIFLIPGESREYDLEIELLKEEKAIHEFVENNTEK